MIHGCSKYTTMKLDHSLWTYLALSLDQQGDGKCKDVSLHGKSTQKSQPDLHRTFYYSTQNPMYKVFCRFGRIRFCNHSKILHKLQHEHGSRNKQLRSERFYSCKFRNEELSLARRVRIYSIFPPFASLHVAFVRSLRNRNAKPPFPLIPSQQVQLPRRKCSYVSTIDHYNLQPAPTELLASSEIPVSLKRQWLH